ncbi:ATP-dependent helicase [Ahrensia kielensis]|uniref:DNA 3'-5' helicase n=1 Tax=Ahrensia kielensis TaxID=76980 RepID=A0ABU9T633_9HYPH
MTINLSSLQREIVELPIGGAVQVQASAGAGKTRVLTERIRRIRSERVREGVIGLTFTNKAADEMLERLQSLEGDTDTLWIGTIHSIAQSILEQYGHVIGLPANFQILERDQDRMEIFLQSLRDDGTNIDEYLNVDDSNEKKNRTRVIQGYMNGFSQIKREMLNEEEIAEKFSENPGIDKAYRDYQSALILSNGIDYEDIIVFAHRILLTNEWVADIYRARYKHVFVDEAQDLNKIQYEFVKAFCGEKIKSVFMVGDPDQMIYGFNGSSSEYLCSNFVRDFSPATYKLTENFRSTKAIIRAANTLKPNSQKESEFALDGCVRLTDATDEKGEAEFICNTIKQLLKLKTHDDIEGDITLQKMVVIARNRFIFDNLSKVLTEQKIEFHLRKGEHSLESSSIFGQLLDLGIRLKINPKDWVSEKKLCSLLKIESHSEWGGEKKLSEIAKDKFGLISALTGIYASLLMHIDSLDLSSPNIRKLVETFRSVLSDSSSLHNEDAFKLELELSIRELESFGTSWTRFKKLGKGETLSAFRNSSSLGQLNADVQNDGLMLSTVHTMKGLERDIVFLMGMAEGVFPDYRATIPSKIEEEKNLAFVAFTRARRWLFITYPNERTMPWGNTRRLTKSRFLEKIKSTH